MAINSADEEIKILGLMTGTSADGLDLCLVNFKGDNRTPNFEVLYSHEIPYPDKYKNSFRNPLSLTEREIDQLDMELGLWFTSQIDKLNLDFDFIASHGQTIKHAPPHYSLQIGSPEPMAIKFRCPVIYDFRTADIEQGGQGAPLIPIVDQFLLQSEHSDVLALNIGGISNITILPGLKNPAPVLAWDTGPGNTLIDKSVRLFTNNKHSYDTDGIFASQGNLNSKLLDELLNHEFYKRPPPRSAGQEQFGDTYFKNLLKQFYPDSEKMFKDLIHTLTVLTAKTIASSINNLSSAYSPSDLYISGGGTFNKTLMDLLKQEISNIQVHNFYLQGINESNKEAFGFAYLGYLYIKGFTANLPSVTGARMAVTLGNMWKPEANYSETGTSSR